MVTFTPARNRRHRHGLTLLCLNPEKVIPRHQAAYLPEMPLTHRSIRIGKVDPTVVGHEKAAGFPHAMPTSNPGIQVAEQGTQHHGDRSNRSASGQ